MGGLALPAAAPGQTIDLGLIRYALCVPGAPRLPTPAGERLARGHRVRSGRTGS